MIRKIAIAVLLLAGAALAQVTDFIPNVAVVGTSFNVSSAMYGARTVQVYLDGVQKISTTLPVNLNLTATEGLHLISLKYLTSSGTQFADTAVFVSLQATPPPPPPPQRTVTLSWNASTSAGVAGYNLFKSTVQGGPYSQINSAPVAALSFDDHEPTGTYYYVATAVTSSGASSFLSNEVQAVIP